MARSYTTMGQVVDQLKANNETNKDINHGIAGIENQFGKFFAYLSKQNQKNLEASREGTKAKAAGAPGRAAAKGPSGGGGGLLGKLGGFGLAGAGIGIGAAGAGLGAFFMGLAGAEAIMAKFGSGDNLKKLLTNLAEGMAAFSTRDLVALGAVLGAGALFGAVPLISGMGAGIGIASIGLGISAFFSGLAAGDMAIGAMESTGANLSTFMKNFAEGLGALNDKQFIALGALMGGGAAFGALFGVGKSAKAAIGIAAIGAGIAGFFGALGVGDKLTQMMNVDGEGLKTLMKNVAEGLGALGDDGFTKVAPLLAAGGALGALFGVGMAGKAALGMTAIGAGVSGFLGALAGVGDLFNKLGVSGDGFKEIMGNVAGGIAELNKIEGDGLLKKIAAMAGVGPALLSVFVGTTAITAIDGLIDGAKKIINFIFGTDMKDSKTTRKNLIQDTVESLKPLNDIPEGLGNKLDTLSSSVLNFVTSFNKAGSDLDPEKFGKKMVDLGSALSTSRELIFLMANGGTFKKDGFFNYLLQKGGFGGTIDFGPAGKGGLLNPELKTDELVKTIGKVNYVLGKTNIAPGAPANLSSTNEGSGGSGGGTVIQDNKTTNNSTTNNTNALISSGPAVDLQDQMLASYGL